MYRVQGGIGERIEGGMSNPTPNEWAKRLDGILRGVKAMYVDADAVTGEEEIYNWDNAAAAITKAVEELVIGADEPKPPKTGIDTWGRKTFTKGIFPGAIPARNKLRAEQRRSLGEGNSRKE